jgi:hypothetical protein
MKMKIPEHPKSLADVFALFTVNSAQFPLGECPIGHYCQHKNFNELRSQ